MFEELISPLGRDLFRGRAFADCLAQASRMGWTPAHPASDRNPLDLADEAAGAGKSVNDYVVEELKADRLHFAGEDPDDPRNFSRVMTVWRGTCSAPPVRVWSTSCGTSSVARGRGACRRVAGAAAPERGGLAGGGASRQARPGHHRGLPDDQHLHLLQHRAAGGDLVREARHGIDLFSHGARWGRGPESLRAGLDVRPGPGLNRLLRDGGQGSRTMVSTAPGMPLGRDQQ